MKQITELHKISTYKKIRLVRTETYLNIICSVINELNQIKMDKITKAESITGNLFDDLKEIRNSFNKLKGAINYTHCCSRLKCGECDCKPKYPNIGCDNLKDCKKEW